MNSIKNSLVFQVTLHTVHGNTYIFKTYFIQETIQHKGKNLFGSSLKQVWVKNMYWHCD